MRVLIALVIFLLQLGGAAGADLAGRYTGEWKSNGAGGDGTFLLNLQSAGGAWKAEISFTFGGQEIKTTMREVKVNQDKVEAVYDFDLQGMTLRSRITAQAAGDKLTGQYHTTTVDGSTPVDEGSWTATRAR